MCFGSSGVAPPAGVNRSAIEGGIFRARALPSSSTPPWEGERKREETGTSKQTGVGAAAAADAATATAVLSSFSVLGGRGVERENCEVVRY